MESMSPAERIQLCDQIAADKRSLGPSLDTVRRIDASLRTNWGMALAPSQDELEAAIEKAASPSLYRKYRRLHDEQADYLNFGQAIPEDVETAFYDVIADPRISGLVHSQKRAMILDAACLLVHLAGALRLEGPALDIGCNSGYHASALATETGMRVHGVDVSAKAIAEAKRLTASVPGLAFDQASLDAPELQGAFEMVYAVRSIDLTPAFAATLAGLLQSGGVAVVVPPNPPDTDKPTIDAIAGSGLGFAFSDVVGGWQGEGRSFEAGIAIVFVRGSNRPMPVDVIEQAELPWNQHFKGYANDTKTPHHEKTQAYCRGHWQAANSSG
jgi:SAM-dependent methyltransferase